MNTHKSSDLDVVVYNKCQIDNLRPVLRFVCVLHIIDLKSPVFFSKYIQRFCDLDFRNIALFL